MRLIITLLVVTLAAGSAVAAHCLPAAITQVESNLDTFDPATFTAGHFVDVYHVTVDNPNAGDVTSLEFHFPGPWVNNQWGGLTFRDNAVPPLLGPNTVAETYFVLPSGTSPLAVDVVDDNTLLQASYTVAGEVALVPGGSTGTLVAVLSVPTGAALEPWGFTGRAAIGGEFVTIGCVPEPAAALLFGLGLFGYLTRSRRRVS